MIIARDPATRRMAARILLAQAGMSILIAVLYWLFASRVQALSALIGGLTGLVANACMTLIALRPTGQPAVALGRLLVGQMMKVALTVAVLVIVARGQWANWPALLIAYGATLLVYWFVPAFDARARRPKG